MKNAILTIVSLAVLGCQAQYKTMLHAKITPTNSVVVDIPDWAKSDTPPGGGGGSGGTTNYDALENKPSINGVTLTGDKTASDLGLASSDEALLSVYYPEGNVTSVDQITTNRLTYSYDDTTMTATLTSGLNATGDVVIPWKVIKDGKEYKVTAIGDNAFNDNYTGAEVKSVVAPTTVISVGDYAFCFCVVLTSASFPFVTSIGSRAFESCTDLGSISIPSAASIGNGAFVDCPALTSVSLLSAISIGDSAFVSCNSLKSVDFGTTPQDNVPTLGDGAFTSVPKSCKIIVPLGMYDEWIAADGWKDLYAAGYQFMGYADAGELAAKRDKTDNIVAVSQLSEWTFSFSVYSDSETLGAEIESLMDANPPKLVWNEILERWEWVNIPKVDGYSVEPHYETDKNALMITLGFSNDSDPFGYSVTAERHFIATAGESYVSPVYVTNAINEATADHVKSNDLQLAVAPINNNVNTMWGYIYGENVWIAVTNYMRSVGGVAPSFQLFEVRDGKTNLVYWSAEEIDTRVGDKIDIAMSNIVDTVVTAKADRAWSKYQSMTGADNPQPNDVTIVSTPSVMLSGGYEWQRFVDTGAEVWVLKCNDLITLGADTNAYFRITDLEGETQFAIEKTASKLVDAVPTATGFMADGNNYFKVTFSGNIQPTIYVSLDLVNSPFIECSATENDYGLTCSWEHDSAANTYTATIAYNAGDGKPSKMFVYGKVLQEGSTVVKHTAPSSFDGGIIINGVQYSVGTATIDGNTVMTLNPVTRAVSE